MKFISASRSASARRSGLAELLLAAVFLMAVANLLALRITQQEMQSLSTPNQHNDVWHMVSISRELQRLEYTARHLLAGDGATQDDLLIRLQVLQSLLDPGANAPRNSTQIISGLADVQRTLAELSRQIDRWLLQLDASGIPTAQQIVAVNEEQSVRLSQSLLSVHLSATQILDRERIALYERFTLLTGMLVALLLGLVLLVIKLILDRRLLKRLSAHLTNLNKGLERRVVRRTRQLSESKALLMFILDASPSEVTLVDAETGKVHFINRRLLNRLGQDHDPERLMVQDLLVDEQERLCFMEELDSYGRVDNREALIVPEQPFWCSLSVKLVEIEGRLSHLLWGFDISSHRELLAALEIQASTDTLTGLYNRRAFYEQGGRAVESCKRYAQPCSVLMVDIDHFKRINDNHGHAVGDEALRATSAVLRATLRDTDIIGRLGGEEFAVVLPSTGISQALETAERLRQAIAAIRPDCPGLALSFTTSIGVASLASGGGGLKELLACADEALYQAKANGRNRVQS